MKIDKKQKWLEQGYETFAAEGPQGIKVEALARKVNKSKSSFYHHFADVDIFMEALLQYHIARHHLLSEAARACKEMVPDFLNLLLAHEQDLFFNRQLRVHRHLPGYSACIDKFHQPIEESFIDIWTKSLRLENERYLAQALLKLVVDNFYMRITEETMNYTWLVAFFQEISFMVRGIAQRNYM